MSERYTRECSLADQHLLTIGTMDFVYTQTGILEINGKDAHILARQPWWTSGKSSTDQYSPGIVEFKLCNKICSGKVVYLSSFYKLEEWGQTTKVFHIINYTLLENSVHNLCLQQGSFYRDSIVAR
ncbi:hypothetical protein OUZ56_030695 [Daphnia magna]|uniref:Uncharacterized protein n=1 Tax=Daphnia magna TaxID=35525 RepID=A0ABQ9ZS25_9CRUS|nr:hypothetical protein OUZ56_030695 [Daphnia magna]